VVHRAGDCEVVMIAIINKGVIREPDYCTYHIQINHRFIASFEHKRSDGLPICLKLAAAAALGRDLEDKMEAINILEAQRKS